MSKPTATTDMFGVDETVEAGADDVGFDPGVDAAGITAPGIRPCDELRWERVTDVYPAPDNLRTDLGDLTELAASIRVHGVIEPLIVVDRLVGGGWMIVAGHRRHAAAVAAGVTHVPVVVTDMTPTQRIETMLVENLQRRNLDPLDEAAGYRLLGELGHSQRDIARQVGCHQSHVARRLKLNRLPEQVTVLVRDGRMGLRQAEQLADVDDADLELVAGEISKRTTGSSAYRDGLLADWVITEAIARVEQVRKHDKAEQTGLTSGLKRLTEQPYQYAGKHRPCKKSEATHWWLGPNHTAVVWARTQQAEQKAVEAERAARPAGPAEPALSKYELERQAAERAEKARLDHLRRVIAAGHNELLAAVGAQLLAEILLSSNDYVDLNGRDLREGLGETVVADLSDDVHALIGVAVLEFTTPSEWCSEQYVLDAWDALGYTPVVDDAGEPEPDASVEGS